MKYISILGGAVVKANEEAHEFEAAQADNTVLTWVVRILGLVFLCIGFGLLRYLNPQTVGALARFGTPQIGFNYLGRVTAGDGGEWSLDAATAIGTGVHQDMPLRHVLAVTPVTEDGPHGPTLVADWLWADGLLSSVSRWR